MAVLVETCEIGVVFLAALRWFWPETPFWVSFLTVAGVLALAAVLQALDARKELKKQ